MSGYSSKQSQCILSRNNFMVSSGDQENFSSVLFAQMYCMAAVSQEKFNQQAQPHEFR